MEACATPARVAALLAQVGHLAVTPCRPGAAGDFRLRRTGRERVELSTLLPVLESFGLAVVEAVPWRFVLDDGGEAFVDDIGLRLHALPTPGARGAEFAAC